MLAQPADDIVDAMARIPIAALEWKLDGARVQVHKSGDDVRIYTRTGNDVTAAAPEIVSTVRQTAAQTLILDGEAIALKQNGAPYPFQDTMRRFGRVLDIDACARRCRCRSSSSTACASTATDLVTLPRDARFDGAVGDAAARARHAAPRHQRSRGARRRSTTTRSSAATRA